METKYRKLGLEEKKFMNIKRKCKNSALSNFFEKKKSYGKFRLKNKSNSVNDFFESKMYCRLMHTKRDNLWNEWHKLDKKRVNFLMNDLGINQDHNAMNFIMKNFQKSKRRKNKIIEARMKKVETIKRFKLAQKKRKKRKNKKLEKKNFRSVQKYLKGSIPDHLMKRITSSPFIDFACPKKYMNSVNNHQNRTYSNNKYKKKVCIGNKTLYCKLNKVNNDIYLKAYKASRKDIDHMNKKSKGLTLNL